MSLDERSTKRRKLLRGGLLGSAVLLGGIFAVLAVWAGRLPKPGEGPFHLEQEIVRYAAAGTGVLFTILLAVSLLPWALDLVEKRSFGSFVAVRHVRATKSGFLTTISILSILGVALSSFALCGVISVMGGFGQDLTRKILGNNAHVTIRPASGSGIDDYQPVLDRLRLAPGVAAATPVVAGDAMASSVANTAGALVRGIDPGSIGNVIDLPKNIKAGKLDYLVHPEKLSSLPSEEIIGFGSAGEPIYKGPAFTAPGGSKLDPLVRDSLRAPSDAYPGIVIGRELAKTLRVYVGDELTLVSPLGDLGPMGIMPRARKFRVAAIFYSEMYEYDATYVYVLHDVAQAFFSMNGATSQLEIRVADAEHVAEVRPAIESAVAGAEGQLVIRDWRELNKNLFSALKLEKIATFVILSIAIVVASFCIVCTLLLMVTEKGREIAILKALGASDGVIMRIFMAEGMIIGGIGTVLGVSAGIATAVSLAHFGVRLDPQVYYIERLPIAVSFPDYVAVALAAMVICTLSTLYPAWAASRLRPVEGLRYE